MKDKLVLIQIAERLSEHCQISDLEQIFSDLKGFTKKNIEDAFYEEGGETKNRIQSVGVPPVFRFSHFLESETYSLRISKRIYKHRLRREKRSTIFRPENPNQSLVYEKAFHQNKEIVSFHNVNRFLISPIHIQQ